MARWKNVRALEAAAALGPQRLALERARAAREAQSRNAVLDVVNQLLTTGVQTAGQVYDQAITRQAEDILAGGALPEVAEKDVLTSTMEFLQGKGGLDQVGASLAAPMNAEARRRAGKMALEHADGRLAMLAPAAVENQRAIARGDGLVPAEDGMGPPAPRDVLQDNAVDQDPVLRLLPESMRAQAKAQLRQVGQEAVRKQTLEDAQFKKLQADTALSEARTAKTRADTGGDAYGPLGDYLKGAAASEVRRLGQLNMSDPVEVVKRTDEVRSRLTDRARQVLVAEGKIGPEDSLPIEAQAAIEKSIEAGLKSVQRDKPPEGVLSNFAANKRAIDGINDVDQLRKEARKQGWTPAQSQMVAQILDEAKFGQDYVDAASMSAYLSRKLEERLGQSVQTNEFVRAASGIMFTIAKAKEGGKLTDADYRVHVNALFNPYMTDEEWRVSVHNIRRDLARQALDEFNAYSVRYDLPEALVSTARKYAESELATSSAGPVKPGVDGGDVLGDQLGRGAKTAARAAVSGAGGAAEALAEGVRDLLSPPGASSTSGQPTPEETRQRLASRPDLAKRLEELDAQIAAEGAKLNKDPGPMRELRRQRDELLREINGQAEPLRTNPQSWTTTQTPTAQSFDQTFEEVLLEATPGMSEAERGELRSRALGPARSSYDMHGRNGPEASTEAVRAIVEGQLRQRRQQSEPQLPATGKRIKVPMPSSAPEAKTEAKPEKPSPKSIRASALVSLMGGPKPAGPGAPGGASVDREALLETASKQTGDQALSTLRGALARPGEPDRVVEDLVKGYDETRELWRQRAMRNGLSPTQAEAEAKKRADTWLKTQILDELE